MRFVYFDIFCTFEFYLCAVHLGAKPCFAPQARGALFVLLSSSSSPVFYLGK